MSGEVDKCKVAQNALAQVLEKVALIEQSSLPQLDHSELENIVVETQTV